MIQEGGRGGQLGWMITDAEARRMYYVERNNCYCSYIHKKIVGMYLLKHLSFPRFFPVALVGYFSARALWNISLHRTWFRRYSFSEILSVLGRALPASLQFLYTTPPAPTRIRKRLLSVRRAPVGGSGFFYFILFLCSRLDFVYVPISLIWL